jgi:hypothetical protein
MSEYPKPHGIPEKYHNILWVKPDRRKNELSLEPGGNAIVIVYDNEDHPYGYNNIKYPPNYIEKTINGSKKTIIKMFLKKEGEFSFNEYEEDI